MASVASIIAGHGRRRQHDREQAVLRRVGHEDVPHARRDDDADPVVVERPDRVLAGGAASEVASRRARCARAGTRAGSARNRDSRSRRCDIAGRETGTRRKLSARGFCRKRAGRIWSVSKLGWAMGNATARNDLKGSMLIDPSAVARTSANLPLTAAAATIAGLIRWVREPGP